MVLAYKNENTVRYANPSIFVFCESDPSRNASTCYPVSILVVHETLNPVSYDTAQPLPFVYTAYCMSTIRHSVKFDKTITHIKTDHSKHPSDIVNRHEVRFCIPPFVRNNDNRLYGPHCSFFSSNDNLSHCLASCGASRYVKNHSGCLGQIQAVWTNFH